MWGWPGTWVSNFVDYTANKTLIAKKSLLGTILIPTAPLYTAFDASILSATMQKRLGWCCGFIGGGWGWFLGGFQGLDRSHLLFVCFDQRQPFDSLSFKTLVCSSPRTKLGVSLISVFLVVLPVYRRLSYIGPYYT